MTRKSSARPLPRYILPESLEIGDTITVTYAPANGIVRTMTGTVAARDYEGTNRLLSTKEGAVLIAYGPSVRRTFAHITLLARRDAEQTPLEGIEL